MEKPPTPRCPICDKKMKLTDSNSVELKMTFSCVDCDTSTLIPKTKKKECGTCRYCMITDTELYKGKCLWMSQLNAIPQWASEEEMVNIKDGEDCEVYDAKKA